MRFYLNAAFIRENNVREVILQVVSGPLESLSLVGFANNLTIRTSTKGPPQLAPTTKNCAEAEGIALSLENYVELTSCSLVITPHSFLYNP